MQVYLPSGLTAFTLPTVRRRSGHPARRHPPESADARPGGGAVRPLGEAVEKGAPLMILEAMKMEHTWSPRAGHVAAYYFAVGEQVSEGSDLLDFVLP